MTVRRSRSPGGSQIRRLRYFQSTRECRPILHRKAEGLQAALEMGGLLQMTPLGYLRVTVNKPGTGEVIDDDGLGVNLCTVSDYEGTAFDDATLEFAVEKQLPFEPQGSGDFDVLAQSA